jgi:C4-dicarboxylate-specific signal transduction histidine kinase
MRSDILITAAHASPGERCLHSGMESSPDLCTGSVLEGKQAHLAHATRVLMLGELAASIAHEMKQPLAAITIGGQTALRVLGRPAPDLAEVRKLTERILAYTQRAADIADRVRAMATGRPPEQSVLSLNDVIEETLQFLQQEIKSRSVSVLHSFSPNAPHVLGDRIQLQQVIANLAVNSIQAMARTSAAERRIVIRTVVPDNASLLCSVEDSGPGLQPQHFDDVFESFFTTKQGGMGLGLHICRSIINAHGGRITADNNSSAGGARFSFTLPSASRTH